MVHRILLSLFFQLPKINHFLEYRINDEYEKNNRFIKITNSPVPSTDDETNNVLSGENEILVTDRVCPIRVLVVSAERSSIIRCRTSSKKTSKLV